MPDLLSGWSEHILTWKLRRLARSKNFRSELRSGWFIRCDRASISSDRSNVPPLIDSYRFQATHVCGPFSLDFRRRGPLGHRLWNFQQFPATTGNLSNFFHFLSSFYLHHGMPCNTDALLLWRWRLSANCCFRSHARIFPFLYRQLLLKESEDVFYFCFHDSGRFLRTVDLIPLRRSTFFIDTCPLKIPGASSIF